MKKRILSALLALVMVLALLPATAFAVEYGTPSPKTPQAAGQYNAGTAENPNMKDFYNVSGNNNITQTVSLCTGSAEATDGRVYGHWYWLDNKSDKNTYTYYEVTSGIVTGTGTSGQWYASIDDYKRVANNGKITVKGAFTVLGDDAINLTGFADTSLSINFVNNVSELTIPATLTNLTISAKYQGTDASGVFGQGHVGAINIDRSTYVQGGTNTGLTVNANNINITSINLSGRQNTLNLTDCTVGDIDMDGQTQASSSPTLSYNAQTVSATRSKIDSIDITNGNGGGVTLQDSSVGTGTGAINFTSDSGNIRVNGQSSAGTITVTPRTKTGSYATVQITGGSVAGVTQGMVAGNDKAISITVSGTNTKFGAIDAEVNGTVNITDADGTSVTVDKGTLTIGGSGVNITGAVTLATDGATRLTMSASNSTFGSIVGNNNLAIQSWNGKRQLDGGNNYGTLTLGSYDEGKVTGGTFANTMSSALGNKANLLWFDTKNLQFFTTDTQCNLYTKTELVRAISDLTTDKAAVDGAITVLGQGGAGKQNFVLKNAATTWAKIGYTATTPLILPETVNSYHITTWLAPSNHNVSIPAGVETNVPYITGSDLTLNASGTSTAVGKITKATTASSNTPGGIVQNQNVTVTLSGNTIHLSGAVTPEAGGIATVYVNLETDVVGTDGSAIVLQNVIIDYNVDSKKVSFNTIQPESVGEAGVQVLDGQLVLNYGTGERYSVTANLSVSATRLGIATEDDIGAGKNIVVTFGGKLSSATPGQKEAWTALFTGTNAKFTYGNNPAMQQAINAAQATITNNNSVSSWITNAQNTIWRQGFKSPNATLNTNYGYVADMAPNTGNFNSNTVSGGAIAAAFDKAYIVPYLVVNVTDLDETGGTLTATLSPYYRVDVSDDADYDPDMAYTVQQGRALNLTGYVVGTDRNQINVTFPLNSDFVGRYMHQDGKYVYQDWSKTKTWTITHAAANGTLGTIVINNNPGLVSIKGDAANAIENRVPTLGNLACSYDTVQAAIDDTVRGTYVQNTGSADITSDQTFDTVMIDGQYTGSCAVTMSGIARKVRLVAMGNQDVTATGANVAVERVSTQVPGGYNYMLELKQDNVAAGTVAIAVNGTAAGTATVSATSAKAGQTITVTVLPNAGQSAKGVIVKTNTGSTINATATGVVNQYSFTVPTGVTSITVTPNFGVAGQATVSVNNNTNGTATVAGNASTVAQGSTVTVYTSPRAGYRATSVSVRFSNGSTVNATSAGTNTWTFTVPANATTVTVTPNFSVDTGLPFLDVAPTEYYLPYVRFVYNNGMMKGDGNDYTFNGNGNITRAQIVLILYRLSGSPTVSTITSFTDVPTNEWYSSAVAWAASNKIVEGRSTTKFDPGTAITRQELAAILYRYNNFRGLSGANLSNLSQFTDRGYVSNYALTPMQWAVGNGIITGTTTNTLSPNGTATRYQAATMLTRYCQTFLKMV